MPEKILARASGFASLRMLMEKIPASWSQAWLRSAIWLSAGLLFAWAWGVLAFSGHASDLRRGAVGLSGGALLVLVWWGRRPGATPLRALLIAALAATCAAFLIRPINEREWAFDLAETPWSEVHGDIVTLHNVRNFEWRSATEATPRWETRTFPLSALRHVDFIMTYWGSPHICHTMVSFDFGTHGRVCASIEARRLAGEDYSPLAGVFRRYELNYVFGDERDVLRVRTNFRAHNDVFLYRLTATPEAARVQFLEYLRAANALRNQPAWYNSLTGNCTTLIREHARALGITLPWDWRLHANGHAHEYLHRLGYISRDLPVEELKRRSHVTPAARLASLENFSEEIRRGRPGF
ncbi:MAG: DUF4105 domain-containing protein [Opitutaceae bacterium]|nr:DUF4105 domain-containing protein [Opitutaceae bacterium]